MLGTITVLHLHLFGSTTSAYLLSHDELCLFPRGTVWIPSTSAVTLFGSGVFPEAIKLKCGY